MSELPAVYHKLTIAAIPESIRGFALTDPQLVEMADEAIKEIERGRSRIAELEAAMSSGSFYKESDIDALMADRELAKDLRRALEIILHAVCGETGFANSVRQASGLAYPWPAMDEAERIARAALEAKP